VIYCIWNNKGGVGKTFLTYCLATEYALYYPNKEIVVIDMCPQANISEMLLGGNGRGEENLNKLIQNERSIASYIKRRYEVSKFGKIGNETTYFVQVNNLNDNMPGNLWLLPGDVDLDICSTIIDYLAQAPEKNSWLKSRLLLKELLTSFIEMNNKKEIVFFIDCNPSFASYTQLAILSSDRIIAPCTGDSSSTRGLYNLFRLVYGIKTGDNLSDEPIFDSFYEKTQQLGLKIPLMHCLLVNKSRVNDKKATASYRAHIKNIENIVENLKNKNSNKFVELEGNIVYNVKDANNIAVVVNYNGVPISKLKHGNYEVYNVATQINQSQIEPFIKDIKKVVEII
jgi:cellulose biosynthesis protein BcsQ